jgi:hypothetical protein
MVMGFAFPSVLSVVGQNLGGVTKWLVQMKAYSKNEWVFIFCGLSITLQD